MRARMGSPNRLGRARSARLLLIAAVAALIVAGCGGSEGPAPAETAGEPAETGALTPPAPPTQPPSTPPPLQVVVPEGGAIGPGSGTEEIETVQRALIELGFKPGPIDGANGPKTEKAVRAFQRKNGLEADGLVGPRTASALNESLAELSGGSAG